MPEVCIRGFLRSSMHVPQLLNPPPSPSKTSGPCTRLHRTGHRSMSPARSDCASCPAVPATCPRLHPLLGPHILLATSLLPRFPPTAPVYRVSCSANRMPKEGSKQPREGSIQHPSIGPFSRVGSKPYIPRIHRYTVCICGTSMVYE